MAVKRLFCSWNRTILEHGGVLLGLEQLENLVNNLTRITLVGQTDNSLLGWYLICSTFPNVL